MTPTTNFKDLGLSPDILTAITKKGFEEPTQIQQLVIPLLLNDSRDIIGQAQTGTGKTAAFGLPILDRLTESSGAVQAIILTPTRELTIQVSKELNSYKGQKNIRIVPIYGGQSIEKQSQQLRQRADIVVGTPGRIMDHMEHKRLDIRHLKYFILDEADEMLNIGFIEDIKTILSQTNPDKKTLLFSATISDHIISLAKKYMKDYLVIKTESKQITADLTDQIYFEVQESNKLEALCRIIDIEEDFYGLIFCRTKRDVDDITEKLTDRGYDVDALHGDMQQNQREKIMDKFRKKLCNILVATDVASRGLDINNLTHVINFSLPQDTESYIHRIGRTGRAGKSGTAITFITPSEYHKLSRIKKVTKTDIRKEQIPSIKTIIATKKKRIQSNVEEMITKGIEPEYLNLAKSLLEKNDPAIALASLLKISFETDLDEEGYTDFKDASVDEKGRTRLFVAKGRKDNMNTRSLVSYIEEKSKVFGKKIQDVQILDSFSFISVSFKDAEQILSAFRPDQPNQRSIVTRAKAKKS